MIWPRQAGCSPMGNSTINRFEWLKAVMQSDSLNPGAKLVASAMAVQFANDETGQLNPSVQTLADYVKASTDTVKRAVKALVNAGWLGRTEGRGRGNRTAYRLASPGKIIALSHPEKGAKSPQIKGGNAAPLGQKKGANLHAKGGKSAPSYIEQSLEQKERAWDAFARHRFPGNFSDGAMYLDKSKQCHELTAWSEWLRKYGFPKLCEMPIAAKSGRSTIFALPYRTPPNREDQVKEALIYFTAMADRQEVRHAAQ